MCCVTRCQKPTGLAAVWPLLRRFPALSICVWRGDRDNKCQHLYDLRVGDKNSLETVGQIRVIIPIQLWIQDQTFKQHGGLLIRAWPPNVADGHCTFGWANPVRRLIFDRRSLTNCWTTAEYRECRDYAWNFNPSKLLDVPQILRMCVQLLNRYCGNACSTIDISISFSLIAI